MAEEFVRLNRLLARRGIASRRGVERLIEEGRITVDGEVVEDKGRKVGPTARICVDGEPVEDGPPTCTVALHKPRGYVTTRNDPSGRPTVMDLLPPELQHLHPVGRLDRDTEGLLLLTNDGELTLALTHPSRGVEKTYRAWVDGTPTAGALRRLREGLLLRDGMTAPAKVRVVGSDKDGAEVEVIIHEGRKRQVRRMLKAIGHPVRRLKRLAVGPLALGGLGPGEHRVLGEEEVRRLREAGEGAVEESATDSVRRRS